MNRTQKIAWFLLIYTTALTILSLTTFVIIPRLGITWPIPYLLVCMLLCGFLGFIPLFLLKKKPGQVHQDERDIMINRRAGYYSFASAYFFLAIASLLPVKIMGTDGTISVRWLPVIFVGTAIFNVYVYAVTILVQYGRGGQDG